MFVAGCSPASPEETKFVTKYDDTKASCLYGFNDGEYAPSSMPAPRLQKAAFDKMYDLALLDAVSAASGSELVRFAALTGVTYYKVNKLSTNNRKLGCPFTGTLPLAPDAIVEKFRTVESETQAEDERAALLGFYLPSSMVRGLTNGRHEENLIAVLNDSDKYIMTHEFMHHLFNRESQISDSDIRNNINTSYSNYETADQKFKSQENAANLIDLVNKFEPMVQNLIVFLKAFYLEEMALETEMHKQYSKGKLKYISSDRRDNADEYILSSAEAAKGTIKQLDINNVAVKLSLKARSLNLSAFEEQSAVAKINNAQLLISKLDTEMNELVASARRRVKSNESLYGLHSGLVAQKIEQHIGCSHMREAEKIRQEIFGQ